jgi:hypothetical protein
MELVPGRIPEMLLKQEVGLLRAAGTKSWLPALRDSIAIKVGYAFGLRRRELTMLEYVDFGPKPTHPCVRQLRCCWTTDFRPRPWPRSTPFSRGRLSVARPMISPRHAGLYAEQRLTGG